MAYMNTFLPRQPNTFKNLLLLSYSQREISLKEMGNT